MKPILSKTHRNLLTSSYLLGDNMEGGRQYASPLYLAHLAVLVAAQVRLIKAKLNN